MVPGPGQEPGARGPKELCCNPSASAPSPYYTHLLCLNQSTWEWDYFLFRADYVLSQIPHLRPVALCLIHREVRIE
ncbi:hypothetical protein EWB00_001151 [Schistosoma japonicum]|uniref:Uncharacterized protein n=1 Tax=Schistosoma japonicum TaxID=6182 RepID=A0A4Z2CK37_SCHJA|nr:hypothetical protein EWB00_001151 [Schistosoma japonicum]